MSQLWLSSIATMKKYPIRQFYIESANNNLSAFYPLSESFFEVEPVLRKIYTGGEIPVGYKVHAEMHFIHNDFKSGGIIEKLDELMAYNTAGYDPYLDIVSARKNVFIACGNELKGTASGAIPTARNFNDDVLISLGNHGTFHYKIEEKTAIPKLIIMYQRTVHSLKDIRLYPADGNAEKLFS